MSQGNDQLTIITNNSAEVCFCFVCHYLHKRRKDQKEQRIHHRDVGKTCAVATEEPATFVVVILASEGHMWQVDWYKLVGKVVDAVDVEVHERLLVDGLKSKFVKVVRPAKLVSL